MLNSPDKIPYTPSVDKRFEISKDPYSKERLAILKNLRSHIKEMFDIDSGISLFGSLSTGKPLDKTSQASADIDLSIFVDEDSLQRSLPVLMKRPDMQEKYAEGEASVLTNLRHLRESSELGEIPKEVYETTLLKSKNGIVITAAKTLIEDLVVKSLLQTGLPEEFIRQGLEVSLINTHGINSIQYYVDAVYKAYRSQDAYFIQGTKWSLSAFWQLDVGGGMKKYRQAFLLNLTQGSIETAESTWKLIFDSVASFKRERSAKDLKGQLPETFQEACKYYGVYPTSGVE